MVSRVRARLGPGRISAPEQRSAPGPIRDQVEESLFGGRKPELLPEDDGAAPLLHRLDGFRQKLARMAGDRDDRYRLLLADGALVAIDREGTVYVGRRFLLERPDDLARQIGVLAHEIGHRPHHWAELKNGPALSREQGEELCRVEETRADFFAGYALGQLGFECDTFCAYVETTTEHPHRIYLPVAVRIETIRAAFAAGRRREIAARKLFPEFARMTSPRLDIGEA